MSHTWTVHSLLSSRIIKKFEFFLIFYMCTCYMDLSIYKRKICVLRYLAKFLFYQATVGKKEKKKIYQTKSSVLFWHLWDTDCQNTLDYYNSLIIFHIQNKMNYDKPLWWWLAIQVHFPRCNHKNMALVGTFKLF